MATDLVAEYLRNEQMAIAQLWEDEVRRDLPALRGLSRPVLLDHLHEFLDGLADWIDGNTVAAERALLAHRWPGNVRELRNAIQRAALLATGTVIGAGDLGLPAMAHPTPVAAGNGHGNGDEPDRATIEAALQRHGGVLAQAAQELGLSRQALYRRLERLGLRRDDSPRA